MDLQKFDGLLRNAQKKMTQRELASLLKKRESEISKWLTGRHNFTINTIAHISLALEAPIINVASSRYSISSSTTKGVAEEFTR